MKCVCRKDELALRTCVYEGLWECNAKVMLCIFGGTDRWSDVPIFSLFLYKCWLNLHWKDAWFPFLECYFGTYSGGRKVIMCHIEHDTVNFIVSW